MRSQCRFKSGDVLPSCERLCRTLAIMLAVLIFTSVTIIAQAEEPSTSDGAREIAALAQVTEETPQPQAEATPVGEATGVLVPSETSLVFSGPAGKTLGRSFTVKAVGGAVTKVEFSASDMLEKNSDLAINSSKISISPASLDTIDSVNVERIQVTIDGAEVEAGTYEGILSIWYQELEAAKPVTITLEATFKAVPAVKVMPASINQTLFAESNSIPLFGGPPTPSDKIQGELPIYLLQEKDTPAEIASAQVLAVTGPKGLVLPVDAVRIATTLPITIPGKGALPLQVVLGARNVPAGDYASNIRVQVTDQEEALTASFKMQVRDQWWWAFGVLVVGLLFGMFINWANKSGFSSLKYIREINRRRQQLNRNEQHLQVQERRTAGEKLESAMNAASSGAAADVVQQRLKDYDDYMTEQAKIIKGICDKIEEKRTAIENGNFAQKAREELKRRLDELKSNIDAGKLESAEAAQQLLAAIEEDIKNFDELEEIYEELSPQDILASAENVQIGLKVRDQLVAELKSKLKAVDETADLASLGKILTDIDDLKEQVEKLLAYQQRWENLGSPPDLAEKLNEADTTKEIDHALSEAGAPADTPEAVMAFSVSGQPIRESPIATAISSIRAAIGGRKDEGQVVETSWLLYTFKIKTGVILVWVLVFIFALLVGWAAIYLNNPTFGARWEDYITLLLWGATINIIGGQQINLQSILTHQVQQINAIAIKPASDSEAGADSGGE